MALRDQPYLPLFIQDFLTDEKLAECSASTTGVYIRLMCLMHKSDDYGKILLKQKYKKSDKQIINFAAQIQKQMPYDFQTVTNALVELVDEKVLLIEGDVIIQKRMVRDNELSSKRSAAGKKGGDKSLGKQDSFAQANAQAKLQANTEYDNDDEIENKYSENEVIFAENFERVFHESDVWLKAYSKNNNLEDSELKKRISQFIIHLSDQKTVCKTYSELFIHFNNWHKKRNNGRKEISEQTTSRRKASDILQQRS